MKDRLFFLTCIVLLFLMPLAAMAQAKPKRDVTKDRSQPSVRVVPRPFSPSTPENKTKQPQGPTAGSGWHKRENTSTRRNIYREALISMQMGAIWRP